MLILSFSNNEKRGNSAWGQEHAEKKSCSEMPNKAKQVGDLLTTIRERREPGKSVAHKRT